QPRRDDFGLKIGKLSHRTSIKDGLGRHIGSCGPLNRNFLNMSVWYMDIDTTANYKLGGAQQHDSVRLDPWVFMFSAGYRF
ncbi:OmpW family outer membrane protein, partial [Escherichia coli]|uniref:OmpW family outer membrane protein n=1 Tax=Escherichia coli TaxID=562 RepID=UPI003314BA70